MGEIFFKEESYKIIGACFEVYNDKQNGYHESVYQECLRIGFHLQKIPFIEKPILQLEYKKFVLEKAFEPDFICYNEIIVELKTAKTLTDEHRGQVINYLKSTGKRLGLLVNFGSYPKLENERLVL